MTRVTPSNPLAIPSDPNRTIRELMQPARKPNHTHFQMDQLCLACGICCDGTLFKDVELHRGDSSLKLRDLGLPVRRLAANYKFPQPCAALQKDFRCSIYASRPCQCRSFECFTLIRARAREISVPDALKIIRRTRRLIKRVKALLEDLGDHDAQAPLRRRYLRVLRHHPEAPSDRSTAHALGDLSLAMHELDLSLATHFYD